MDSSPFSGRTVAFTGKLASLGRREAQVLVERLGGTSVDQVTSQTNILVVGAEGFPKAGIRKPSSQQSYQSEKSNKVKKAEEVNSQFAGSVRILSEEDFCKLAGLPTADNLKQQLYGLRDIRELYPFVQDDRLRYLDKCGLIRSVARTNVDVYYRFRDLLVIKQVNTELQRRVPFRAILRSLFSNREGQLALDFQPAKGDAQPAKVIKLSDRRSSISRLLEPSRVWSTVDDRESDLATRYFREASELDEGDELQQEQAIISYRRALNVEPNLVPALINLGNIHYARNALVEAQALYQRALSLESDCFEAYFNLGNIHHDLGQYNEAVKCYQDALDLNPTYAAGHFYIAVTFEKLGKSKDAKPHWRTYQKLAPDGEWTDLARELSE